MTELLEREIAQLKTLPTDRQDAIAAMILEELESDRALDEALANSPDRLNSQLQQWLNIMPVKLKNSIQKHCVLSRSDRISMPRKIRELYQINAYHATYLKVGTRQCRVPTYCGFLF